MSRRATILLATALLGIASAAVFAGAQSATPSDASYTTSSQSTVLASAATTSDWLSVYAEGGDPEVSSNYAHQHNVATDPLVASGQDASLAINWGDYPDLNNDFTFVRVLTIKTPATFPDPLVQQITVAVTLTPDPGGTQPLKSPDLRSLGLVERRKRTTSMTLRANERAQLDLTVHTKKNPWDAGDLFRPHVVLTLTYAGGPAAYYVYDFTTLLYII